MRAVDYYDKYAEDLCSENRETVMEAISAMFDDFKKDMNEKKEERNISSYRAVVSLVREANAKWNAVVNLLIKRKGFTPIIRDGLWITMQKGIPELSKENPRG